MVRYVHFEFSVYRQYLNLQTWDIRVIAASPMEKAKVRGLKHQGTQNPKIQMKEKNPVCETKGFNEGIKTRRGRGLKI